MSATKAALLGFGVVGSEVYGYFQESPVIDIRSVLIQNRSKSRPYKVSGKERVLNPDILASSFEAILEDEEIKVVIELTGSPNAGSEFILPALKRRKHVVTANKQAILSSWEDIAATAAANGVIVRYDATVGAVSQ